MITRFLTTFLEHCLRLGVDMGLERIVELKFEEM